MSEGIPLEQGLRLSRTKKYNTFAESEGIPLEQGLRLHSLKE